MYRRLVPKSRNHVFECPVTRGVSEYVRKQKPLNPYRQGTPHRTLYFLGYIIARDSDEHPTIVDFNEIVRLSDALLKSQGYPVPPRTPVRDR